jgi:PAS domain S-box-containing protein
MTDEALKAENERLLRLLEEAEETISAIQSGAVDAFVVNETTGQRVYTLEGADRPYRLLVEEMQQGAATLQDDGAIAYCNRQLAALLNMPHPKLIGRRLREFIASEDLEAFDTLLRECPKRPGSAEVALRRGEGERLQVHVTCNALPPECGAAVGVLVTDLTSQKTHEHLKLLVDELNHRVKNTLASVQSIAQQTLRRTDRPENFVESFTGRIQALARVHTMLSEMTWQGADLRALIRDQVLLGPIDETRLTAQGPSVTLDPQMALHLAMVVHELGTNSCKYGALSTSSGWVTVSWTNVAQQLSLNWVERGGPAVSSNGRRGFGTAFIEQSVKAHRGNAQMLSEPSGVTWTISLPLSGSRSGRPALPVRSAPVSSAPRGNGHHNTIEGRRVLVVEDEALVAMDLIAILEQAGVKPVGPATSVQEALQSIASEVVDAALVDANLHGLPADEIAAALVRRGVPFAFVTGYDRVSLPRGFQDEPWLSKPFTEASLLDTVTALLSRPVTH